MAVRLRLICDTVASLDARHPRSVSGLNVAEDGGGPADDKSAVTT
jgi:hypothetical protein